MSSSPRGYAVIITMTKGRPGADVDERDIGELFKQLSFDVIILRDRNQKVTFSLNSPVSKLNAFLFALYI